ncbi:Starch-binding associating with outer membrane [Fodinibius roseus]|uniref:Starch-binding associating with outer membrane n=1 Tax=Fodinibius roseus TaxID=1194090 RepID=A0A1M5AEU4_9BACT|nr:SusD/RagB family nutrient-binding outer membrane lipoprotein [Fodinibius roseus]SHF28808.1 Starch-binding associating with outer membrane [Fodinibius roseus]
MKQSLYILLMMVFVITSCNDLQKLDDNPNSVSETPPQLLLTEIASNAFQVEGLDPLLASRMIVSTSGESALQYYKWNRGSFDAYNRLRNVTKMIEEAKRVNKPVYEALGKFFRAYYFYNLTMTFGDIPYSEALQGEMESIYVPAYDTQKKVFEGILTELEEADSLLQEYNDVIEGDIIYSSDASKWRRLVNSYRLKVLMTLSNKVGKTDLDIPARFASIAQNEPLIESIADNGQMVFYDQLGSRYGEYNESTYGSDIYVDSTFIKRLQDRQDPRLFIYATQTKNASEQGLARNNFDAYEGGNPIGQYGKNSDKAAAGNISLVDLRYTEDPTNEPHVLLGYSELQFILAEARVRDWITMSSAESYYDEGVKASFAFYNTYAENYASYVDEQAAEEYLQGEAVDLSTAVTTEEKIKRIALQKYLRSFLQGGWTLYFEQLRTGYPEFLQPQTGSPPTRWIYPQSEYQNNKANVSAAIDRQFGAGNDGIRETSWWLN